MRAAHWAAGKSATVAHLPASAIYLRSALTECLGNFVVEVLERVEAGAQL
jgi:hypothetical protein